jgi:tryptophan-rich sensory protein
VPAGWQHRRGVHRAFGPDLVCRAASADRARELRLWGWQLAANALWAPVFFGLHSPALAMAVISVMLLLIALTMRRFFRVLPTAGWLMVPYLAWCCYAAYLNAGFWWLNGA